MAINDKVTFTNPGISCWAKLNICSGATSMMNGINMTAEKPSETIKFMRVMSAMG